MSMFQSVNSIGIPEALLKTYCQHAACYKLTAGPRLHTAVSLRIAP
jgi:hypothetical protein